MSKKLTTSQFIEKSNELHNFKFDYSKVEYKDNHSKVIIICPIHKEFEQRPLSHLSGIGCKSCGIDKRAKNKAFNNESFINKANLVHNFKYDYSLVEYKNAHAKIIIICKTCNNTFSQAAYSHLKGHGCSKCNLGSLTGWSKSQWIDFCNLKNTEPIVYIIRCFNENEEFVKIGRTSFKTSNRFDSKQKMPYSYVVIKEIKGSPDFIWDKEHELHKLYKGYSYNPLLSFGGQYECFNISILSLL